MNNKMTADQVICAVDKLKKEIEDSLGYDTYYMHVHTGSVDTRDGWYSDEFDDKAIDMAIQVGD